MNDTIAAPPTCSARTGWARYHPTEPLWCGTTVGLRQLIDKQGVARYFCSHAQHRRSVVRLYGEWVEPEQADGLTAAKARDFVTVDGGRHGDIEVPWVD